MHYPYEIRSDEAVFEEIPEMKLPDQMVGLAEDIIDRMSGEFEPDKFEDRYENAMIELIRSKQAGLPAPKEKPPARPANVVNLMDALRRSIEDRRRERQNQPRPASARRRKRRLRRSARRRADADASIGRTGRAQAHRVRCGDVARARISLSLDSMKSLQDLADEAFRDLLKKHRRPTTLKEMLRESAAVASCE